MSEEAHFDDDHKRTMIEVKDVTMVFNIANQQLNSLKEYFIALARRQLFFKEFKALKGVSLTVKQGDVFGIIGTNGSGKSTLLKIIAGVLEPTEGSVTINGHIAPLIELGAGFDLELTARENIYLNGSLLGYPRKFIAKHFDDIVDFAEIRSFLDMPLKNYSSGMVARIAFAIATVIVPEILIVDEVLSVGDFMFQQKCEERIQKLIAEYGTTVLIVSHSNDQIARLCNKALWIEKGTMRLFGPANQVCDIYRALGGHKGSAESEQKVFSILQKPYVIPDGFIGTVTGEDNYEIAARLAMAIERDRELEGVVITSDYDDLLRYIALSLFRGAGYVPLLSPRNDISNALQLALKKLNPRRIVIFERDALPLSPEVKASIQEICPDARIEVFTSSSTDQSALQAASWLTDRGVQWSKRAWVFSPSCHKEFSALLSADRFDECSNFTTFHSLNDLMDPVLYIDQLDSGRLEDLASQIQAQLATYADLVEEVVVVGDRLARSGCGDVLESLGYTTHLWQAKVSSTQDGLAVLRGEFMTPVSVDVEKVSLADDSMDVVDATLTAEVSLGSSAVWQKISLPPDRREGILAMVSSLKAAEEMLSAATLAFELAVPMIFEEHDDLDSVSAAIDGIGSFDGAIDTLLFAGGGSCFEPVDKMVLAKAALETRIKADLEPEKMYLPGNELEQADEKPLGPPARQWLESLSNSSVRLG